jgi:hypothetical protein
MAAYIAYEWERSTWPEFQTIKLTEEECLKYAKKFARHFKHPYPPKVTFTNRNWGQARSGISVLWWYGKRKTTPILGVVDLPAGGCKFSLFIHEFAHIMADYKNRRYCHHDRRFKRQLKRAYTWAKRYLPKRA